MGRTGCLCFSGPAPIGLSSAPTHRTWGLSGSPPVSRNYYPVPLSRLSRSDSVDSSEAEWASICPLGGSLTSFLFSWLSLVTSHKTPYLVGLWEEFERKTHGRPRPSASLQIVTGQEGSRMPALADKLRFSTSHIGTRTRDLQRWQGRAQQRCGP